MSSRLLFSHEVSRDYAERRVQILFNRKYHGGKGLILLMFHLIHNVICGAINVKIVKSMHATREMRGWWESSGGISSTCPVLKTKKILPTSKSLARR